MKKIRNIGHLEYEKNLMLLKKLQLEKDIQRDVNAIRDDLKRPPTVLRNLLLPAIINLGSFFLSGKRR